MTVYRLSNTREVNVPERRKVWFRIPAEEEPVMPNVALAVFAAGVRRWARQNRFFYALDASTQAPHLNPSVISKMPGYPDMEYAHRAKTESGRHMPAPTDHFPGTSVHLWLSRINRIKTVLSGPQFAILRPNR
jgi:hypothetical protein